MPGRGDFLVRRTNQSRGCGFFAFHTYKGQNLEVRRMVTTWVFSVVYNEDAVQISHAFRLAQCVLHELLTIFHVPGIYLSRCYNLG